MQTSPMCKVETKKINSGQSSLEFMVVLGLILIPAISSGIIWVKQEWSKSECAFQSYKAARINMIQTGKAFQSNGISVVPLESLDKNKGPLEVSDVLKEVSQLWEQLLSV